MQSDYDHTGLKHGLLLTITYALVVKMWKGVRLLHVLIWIKNVLGMVVPCCRAVFATAKKLRYVTAVGH